MGAPRAREFMEWALEHFEVHWLSTWTMGRDEAPLRPWKLALMAHHTGLPIVTLAEIRSLPWSSNKHEAIDALLADGEREWFWIEDGFVSEDLEWAKRHGVNERLIYCNSFENPKALLEAQKHLERALAGIPERTTPEQPRKRQVR